jgi:NADH:ubiquinone oxidoreductase subunit 3 (subunit A)
MWSNLSVGETIMLVFAVTYLLSLGVLACGWALRLGHRHKDAEAKRYDCSIVMNKSQSFCRIKICSVMLLMFIFEPI